MQKSLWFVILFVLLMLPSAGTAEETKDNIVLMDDIIVTASRFEQHNERVPAQVTVITAEDIQAGGAQSVPEALRNLGGVIVSDLNGNGFNQTVDMGGFGETAGRHVVVLVNGRKLNPIDQSGINFIAIPIENVAKIEVLHGGNSVLYGGDAMGGVINIITKEAEKGIHGRFEAGVGSYGTAKGTTGISFTSGRFGGTIGGTFYDTDGYRDHSEAERKSANAGFTFDPSDTLGFSFEASTTQADYEYPGSLTLAQMEADRKQANPWYPDDGGESQDDAYVLSMNTDWGEWGLFNFDLSCRDYERQDITWGSSFDYDYITLGANPQYVLDRSVFGKDNRLTLGVEYYDTDYDAKFYNFNVYDHSQDTVGFYLQDEFSLLESLILNFGVRYEEVDTALKYYSQTGTNEDINQDEWAWNVGLAYIFAPKSKVYVRAYQAYRFPKVDEFMRLSDGAVNTNLEHETSRGYEVGARFVALNDRLVADFRLFSFDVDDEITWNAVAGQNENLDETRHQGGELNINFKTTDLITMFGGFGYTHAELTAGPNDGKKIPLVPEFKANLGFALNFDFGLTFRCQYNHLGKRYAGGDSSNVYDKLDSADTVDLYLSYPYKQVEFFLNATNIFNEEYYNGYNYGPGFESYYPMPEAVYYGGIRVKF
jgi:iron complex outermembrane receptor protein